MEIELRAIIDDFSKAEGERLSMEVIIKPWESFSREGGAVEGERQGSVEKSVGYYLTKLYEKCKIVLL